MADPVTHRRIAAARLMTHVPEIRAAIEEGKLNLTHIAMAQSVFKRKNILLLKKKRSSGHWSVHPRGLRSVPLP